jgi:prepilin-type N-terminal cleavage/methylation domain-containing protein
MKNGFTLLEMSVVVLVIALLTAGIISGKELIRQSQLRAILQEYDRYVQGVKEFRDKYQELPGDMPTAQTIWGVDNDSGANPCPNNVYSATAATTTSTCNGNGDGMIGHCTNDFGATSGSCANPNEIWRAWQQLSIAGFIEGRYTGRTGGASSSTQATPGLNVPKSKFAAGGWTLVHYLNVANQTWLVGDQYGNVLLYGGGRGAYNGVFTTEPIVPVGDASSLDTKIDDGAPTTGIFRAWDDYWMPSSPAGPTAGAGSATFCVNGTSYFLADSATYRENQQLCSLIFIPGL